MYLPYRLISDEYKVQIKAHQSYNFTQIHFFENLNSIKSFSSLSFKPPRATKKTSQPYERADRRRRFSDFTIPTSRSSSRVSSLREEVCSSRGASSLPTKGSRPPAGPRFMVRVRAAARSYRARLTFCPFVR